MKTRDYRGMDGKMRKNYPFPDQITSDAKQYLIIKCIAEGMTYTDITFKFMEEWGLGLHTVQNYINEAIEYMRSEKAKESLISMNMQRLDSIISDSMEDKDRKNAIKAIDVQNKLAGGYEEKVKIEGDSEINLHFDF